MLRLQIPCVELKEENMRASMLALAGILVCAASAAPAQDPPAAQPQSQIAPQVAPEVTPPPAPKAEGIAEPKDDAAPAGGGRFTFSRVDNGFLRLDTQNGQVSYCRAQTAGWSCQAVPENRSELETDVSRLRADMNDLKARLQDEIAALRREVAALKDPAPPRPSADLTPPDKGGDVVVRLPTHEDVARARALIETTWQRVVEMISTVQKDLMRKS